MPIYEYQCKKCSTLFELRRPVSDIDKRAKCTKCGSQATTRKLSVFAIASGAAPDLMSSDLDGSEFGGGDFGGGDFGGGDDFGGMGGDDFDFDDDF